MQTSDQVFEHAARIFQNIEIAVTNHVIAFTHQPAITFNISLIRGMLSAIGLDNELAARTNKICNIRPDRRLATKFCAGKPPVSQQ